MKPFFSKTFLLLCALLLWAGTSMASPLFVGDTSSLTGNLNHQDTQTNVNTLVDFYNFDNDPDLPENLTLLGKWDVGKGWSDDTTPGFGFTGSFTDGGKAGDWFASTGWLASDPIYYSLKAADHFALYYASGETSGKWEIDFTNPGGKIPDLSHISFWTAKTDHPPNPVPEPGTLALVGLGLATIAGYRRKRHAG